MPNSSDDTRSPTARLSPNDVQRRSRLDLCRSADAFVRAVEGMAVSDDMKGEIANMVRLAQRMALRVNDGHVSPAEPMRTW